MQNLIGYRLRQSRQADAWETVSEPSGAREDTIIHANDEPCRPLTVAPLIRSAALHGSD
jgi:hypothetical protein